MPDRAVIEALAVVLPFFGAGILQTAFLKSAVSERFSRPLDGGGTWRGKRILGDNKTLRGFVVLVPATTIFFVVEGYWLTRVVGMEWVGWELSLIEWGGLGLAASLGYAFGELPNSFIKRQLDIPPGGTHNHPVVRWAFVVWDQLDSIVCSLLVVSILVPVSLAFWLFCLGIGGILHWGFNGVLWWLGLKERAA